MNRFTLLFLASVLFPAGALAAPSSFFAAQSILATSSFSGNAYIGGTSVVLTAPVAGDLSVVGGTIVIATPVAGDELLFGGSISARAPIAGDLRAAGGSIALEEPIGGDLVAFGYIVNDFGRAEGSVFIAAMNTTLTNGATGPVTIYGNNVSLGGNFNSNVTIVAAGRVSLAPGTQIRGKLTYEAPEPAAIPVSAKVSGGIDYTSTSYLPGANASRMLAIASIGIFLFVRILGALILAGLLAGLFSRPAEEIVSRLSDRHPRHLFLILALGFATLVATPVFILLLALTFVGLGVALLVSIIYALLVLLALMYAGISIGGLFAYHFKNRNRIYWHDGVFGMLLLSMFSLVPVFGFIVTCILTSFAAGVLLLLLFHYLFVHESERNEN